MYVAHLARTLSSGERHVIERHLSLRRASPIHSLNSRVVYTSHPNLKPFCANTGGMVRRHLWLVFALILLSACAPSTATMPSSGSLDVPTASPAERQADDWRMEREVARCHETALGAPAIAAEDAAFLAEPVVTEGPFKGCVVDIEQARPVTRVTGLSELPPVPVSGQQWDGRLIVANFQHDDTFWFAAIDLAAVREVLVQMEHTGQLNHGQVRVTFDTEQEGVRLYPQGAPDGRRPTVLNDITLTADGIAPLGVDRPASILPARQYPLLYRAMSTQQKVQIMTDADGRLNVVEQFRILDGADPPQLEMADAFLTSWIDHGSRAQFGTMFQLVPLPPYGSLNCTSALFQILDETVTYPNPDLRAQLLDEFLPLHIPTYLSWRGYEIDQIREPDLNVQLGLP
jgi:hypothetical protein